MSNTFYKPFVTNIYSNNVIIYPMIGLEEVMNRGISNIVKFLTNIYSTRDFGDNSYQIVIVWNDGKNIMTDVWIRIGRKWLHSGL